MSSTHSARAFRSLLFFPACDPARWFSESLCHFGLVVHVEVLGARHYGDRFHNILLLLSLVFISVASGEYIFN